MSGGNTCKHRARQSMDLESAESEVDTRQPEPVAALGNGDDCTEPDSEQADDLEDSSYCSERRGTRREERNRGYWQKVSRLPAWGGEAWVREILTREGAKSEDP